MQFLTTKQVSGEVELVIREARQFVTLITPYISIPAVLVERLKAAQDKGVKVSLVVKKFDVGPDEEQKLRALDRTYVAVLDNVHAKCYLNETRAIVTSMNLYRYSEENNREMGIAILKGEEQSVYEEIKAEADEIAREALPYFAHGPLAADRELGFCIRCGRSIPLDPDKPLCRECYREWAEWSNPDYEERYCHSCGGPVRTSVRRPLCERCFRS